ncbi:MAG: hypothetical protein ACREAM_12360, partial [Blastocatellia bacterium]
MSSEDIQAFDWLAREMRTNLHLTAQALEAHQGDAELQAALERQFNHTLLRLAHLHGRGVYEHLGLVEVFILAIEAEARLAQEYQEEQGRLADLGKSPQQPLAEGVERHTRRARRLAEMLAGLGHGVYTHGIPSVALRRGVYVAPFSEAMRYFLVGHRLSFQPWKDGALVMWPGHHLNELQERAEIVEVLYFDVNELEDAINRLDSAGLDREIARRLAAARDPQGSGTGDEFLHHVNRLLLHQVIVLHSLQELLEPEHPHLAASIQPLIDESVTLIRAALLAHPSWAPEADPPEDNLGDNGPLQQLA